MIPAHGGMNLGRTKQVEHITHTYSLVRTCRPSAIVVGRAHAISFPADFAAAASAASFVPVGSAANTRKLGFSALATVAMPATCVTCFVKSMKSRNAVFRIHRHCAEPVTIWLLVFLVQTPKITGTAPTEKSACVTDIIPHARYYASRTRDHAPAADWDHDGIQLWHLLQELERHCALA